MNRKKRKHCKKNAKSGKLRKQDALLAELSPQQLAVIVALLTNSLEVNSVLIDREQTIQVVLEGSLRRQTRVDELLEELSGMNLGDVIQSIQRMS